MLDTFQMMRNFDVVTGEEEENDIELYNNYGSYNDEDLHSEDEA